MMLSFTVPPPPPALMPPPRADGDGRRGIELDGAAARAAVRAVAMRRCLLKGAGIHDLGQQMIALSVLGVEILSISVARFRKRLT
jgi:hypothetical protein